MTPAATVAIRSESRSTPTVARPRSAKLSASGRPTRPRPTIDTSFWKEWSGIALPTLECRPAFRRQLAGEGPDEGGVVAQVARCQAQRVLRDAERPFEAAVLHPARRLPLAAGDEVERGADSREHRRLEARPHPRHPLLLSRRPDPDPDDV